MRVINEGMGQSTKTRKGGEWGPPSPVEKKAGGKRERGQGKKEAKEPVDDDEDAKVAIDAHTSKTLKKKFPDEDEEVLISKFIQSLSTDNYSDAHKYLRGIVNTKIQSRIATAANKPFFN